MLMKSWVACHVNRRLVDGFPYIEEEVVYAIKEYATTAAVWFISVASHALIFFPHLFFSSSFPLFFFLYCILCHTHYRILLIFFARWIEFILPSSSCLGVSWWWYQLIGCCCSSYAAWVSGLQRGCQSLASSYRHHGRGSLFLSLILLMAPVSCELLARFPLTISLSWYFWTLIFCVFLHAPTHPHNLCSLLVYTCYGYVLSNWNGIPKGDRRNAQWLCSILLCWMALSPDVFVCEFALKPNRTSFLKPFPVWLSIEWG